jgi:hypothetical protein
MLNYERRRRGIHRRVSRSCCLFALSWLLGVDGAGLWAADVAELRERVAALSSDQYAQREAATTALITAGADAVPLVAAAATSGDREASYRCLLVLQRMMHARDGEARRGARRALGELAKSDDSRVARIAGRYVKTVVEEAIEQLRSSGAALSTGNDGLVRSVNFSHSSADDGALVAFDHIDPVEVNLTNTNVTDTALERLASHPQLELINLMSTKITDAGMKHVTALTAIRTFSIERTAVTDAGLENLKGCSNLKTLYLGGSRVTGPGLKHLEKLPIEYLSFAYSPVDDSIVEHIVAHKHIKTLGLDDTKVTDACLPALARLERLETLWLDNCAITDAAIPHFKRFTRLKKLHVQNTRLSPQGFARLRDELDTVQFIGAPAKP